MHCLTFGVEEHFQVSSFDSPMRRRHWDTFESRVASNTEHLLELLDQHKTRATFFVLGWVAERQPGLIKTISACGHEIASYGYNHELVTAQTPDLFRHDVRRAKAILEDLTGRPVQGYRAPGFTITSETSWALPILVEEGHTYDSSILPVRQDHGGIPGSWPWCHLRETASGHIWEIPPTTVRLAGMRWLIAGGPYFRLLPFSLIRALLNNTDRDGHAVVMYFHAWEFDRHHPRMEGPFVSQLLHYLNFHQTEKRLSALLERFSFAPIQDHIDLSLSASTDHSVRFAPAAAPAIATDLV
ncbi:MAG TPA: XrtA system polysaccharide deacetylase [Nitrospiraceae bacterium]|nr:XrtA system polysaccharide deacetylase [Nitrospiraceae bacterium]